MDQTQYRSLMNEIETVSQTLKAMTLFLKDLVDIHKLHHEGTMEIFNKILNKENLK